MVNCAQPPQKNVPLTSTIAEQKSATMKTLIVSVALNLIGAVDRHELLALFLRLAGADTRVHATLDPAERLLLVQYMTADVPALWKTIETAIGQPSGLLAQAAPGMTVLCAGENGSEEPVLLYDHSVEDMFALAKKYDRFGALLPT